MPDYLLLFTVWQPLCNFSDIPDRCLDPPIELGWQALTPPPWGGRQTVPARPWLQIRVVRLQYEVWYSPMLELDGNTELGAYV